MSYLDAPRFHFFGNFFANPSTINNATENYALDAVYNNQPASSVNPSSVWWNPVGQAFFRIPGPSGQLTPAPACTVTGAYDSGGPVTSDPLIGASFVSILAGGPPAQYGRLADLDPDQQVRSMVVGLTMQLTLPGASAPALTGSILPMTITDIWGRIITGATSGLNTPACLYQSVMTNLQWGDVSSSPLLQQLQSQSPAMLSFKANVDNYDGTPTSPTFNYGRIAGTIGPYADGEPLHFVAKRKMSLNSSLVTFQGRPLVNNVPFQVSGSILTIDLGNAISTSRADAASPPVANNLGPVNAVIDPAGANIAVPIYSTPDDYERQYAAYAGIFTIALSAGAASAIVDKPVGLGLSLPQAMPAAFIGRDVALLKEGLSVSAGAQQSVPAGPEIGVAEDPTGYYAGVDYNAIRVEADAPSWAQTPNAVSGAAITADAPIPLVCTKFGQPAANVEITITNVVNTYQFPDAEGNFPAINNSPMTAISFPCKVTTDGNGRAAITFTAGPLDPSQRDARRADIDGQIYTFNHTWTTDPQGQLPQPITVLVFENTPYVQSPTWTDDVSPILTQYARLYPFMKGLIDLSNYGSVTDTQFGWAAAIQAMISLPADDPAYMPVTRDLSLLHRDMILRWYQAGAPLGTQSNS
jgi:hypothetical protein